jgi:uncharacterized protein
MAENHNMPPHQMTPPPSGQSTEPTQPRSQPEPQPDLGQPDRNSTKRAGRGFAAMDPERQREIPRKGGRSVPDEKRSFSQNRELAAAAGRKGGQESGGNFANDRERAAAAGRKGGQH